MEAEEQARPQRIENKLQKQSASAVRLSTHGQFAFSSRHAAKAISAYRTVPDAIGRLNRDGSATTFRQTHEGRPWSLYAFAFS